MNPAANPEVVVPQTFLDMPRWWTDGSAWLADLPEAISIQCSRWHLRIDGDPVHGSNALVVPVMRDAERFVLRMTPPGPDVTAQVQALRFWDGRGTVLLADADEARGAMLLERLDMDGPLTALPVAEALPILGHLMRRLAVDAPADAPSTSTLVKQTVARLERLTPDRAIDSGAIDSAFLDAALAVAPSLSVAASSDLAVNGDLHTGQVMRGTREPWLVVDPLLMRGDIDYDLARALWTRIDEMADTEIVVHFEAVVDAARLDRDRARDWVVFRTVDYWLWCLDNGLTEDPQRCRRLMAAFVN
jgi:streptomycin 6-kinase